MSTRKFWESLGGRYDDHSFDDLPQVFSERASPADTNEPTLGFAPAPRVDRLLLRGEKSGELLQGQVTNEVLELGVMTSCLAFHLNSKGKTEALMRISKRAENEFLVEIPEGELAALQTKFAPFAMLADVDIKKLPEVLHGFLFSQGTPAVLEQIPGVNSLEAVTMGAFSSPEKNTLFDEVMFSNDPGFPCHRLAVPMDRLEELHDWIHEQNIALRGQEFLETKRIKAGRPRWALDIVAGMLAPECGLPEAIHYEKGCYVGQEVVARIRTYGQVNRELRGLTSTVQLEMGSEVFDDEGKVVGRIGSSRQSAEDGQAFSLALLHKKVFEPGRKLRVETQGQHQTVEVQALPFSS